LTSEIRDLLERIPRIQQELTVRFKDIRSITKKYPDAELQSQVQAWWDTSDMASRLLGRAAVQVAQGENAKLQAGAMLGEVEMRRREEKAWAERHKKADAELAAILQDTKRRQQEIVNQTLNSREAVEVERRHLRDEQRRLKERQVALGKQQQALEQLQENAKQEAAKAEGQHRQALKFQEETRHIQDGAQKHWEAGRKYMVMARQDATRQEGITRSMNEALTHYQERLAEAEGYKNEQARLKQEAESRLREVGKQEEHLRIKEKELKAKGRYVTKKWQEVQAGAKGAGVDVSKGIIT
jgi:hypothetical protein